MPGFRDPQGAIQQLPLTVFMYREAAEAGMTFQQFVNRNYPTDAARFGSTFDQLCASEGIVISSNRELGIRSSTMAEVLEGRPSIEAGVTVKDAVPASRILFPAVTMQAVEDRLIANLTMTASAFESMIAIDDSVAGDRYEQPQINMTKPSQGRHQGIAQLALPATMMTLTVSDRPGNIPTFALGLEVSDQALRASTLDFVSLSIARQIAVERNERAQGYMLALLNGDQDNVGGGNESSLATLGKVTTSNSLDTAATGGVLTQKAWVKYMTLRSQLRTITHIVTDVDGALAIENRTGRPNTSTDDPKSPRLNTLFDVINPLWPQSVKMFLTVDPAWPANTVMGFDQAYAIRRIRNLNAEYQAIEAYVMRRSQSMRFDFGETVTRLFSDAYDVLTIS